MRLAHRRTCSAKLAVALGIGAIASGAPVEPQLFSWQPPLEIASGPGERGPWRQNESRYRYVDDPTVLALPDGGLAVAWVDQARKDVLFRRWARFGASAAAPVNVSDSADVFSWLPRLAYSPREPRHLYALWQEIIFSGGSHGGDILFARSTDGGASFSAPLNLSRSVGGDGKGRINEQVWHNGSLDLAVAPSGEVYAVWTEYHGALWFSRSSDGGRSFAAPVRLAGTERAPARAPSLATGRDGTIHVAWTLGEDESADIRIATSKDRGASFGEPRVLGETTGYSDAPQVAVDGAGILHVVYAESAGGPFDRFHVRYARSSAGATRFEPSRRIAPASDAGAEGAAFPALELDAKGRIYVLWERYPEDRARPRGLGIAVSRDGGARFTSPLNVPASADASGAGNGSYQGLLMDKLDVGSDGTIAIVNSSLDPGGRSRVWLMRGALASR